MGSTVSRGCSLAHSLWRLRRSSPVPRSPIGPALRSGVRRQDQERTDHPQRWGRRSRGVARWRIRCGDCGAQARCRALRSDPPYGVEYVGKTKNELTIRNDGVDGLAGLLAGAFAVATAALKPGAAISDRTRPTEWSTSARPRTN